MLFETCGTRQRSLLSESTIADMLAAWEAVRLASNDVVDLPFTLLLRRQLWPAPFAFDAEGVSSTNNLLALQVVAELLNGSLLLSELVEEAGTFCVNRCIVV